MWFDLREELRRLRNQYGDMTGKDVPT